MKVQERLIQGDSGALEEIYRYSFSKVYGVCMTYVKDPEVASDLVQEVYLKLWRNKKRISKELPLEQQLFVLTKNIIFDHFRKKATEEKMVAQYQVSVDQELTEEEPSGREEQLREIHALIEKLPEKQRQVVQMSKFRGLSYDEIAEELNISRHTVSSHFSAAMKFLKSHLSFVVCLLFLDFFCSVGAV